jgi:hypothetical protein
VDDARRNLAEEVATLLGQVVTVPEQESASANTDVLFRASDIGLRGPAFEAFQKLDTDTTVEVLQLLVARAGDPATADQIFHEAQLITVAKPKPVPAKPAKKKHNTSQHESWENWQQRQQECEARLPGLGVIPPFDDEARGAPEIWNQMHNVHTWGKKSRWYFTKVPDARVDVTKFVKFLKLRRTKGRRPISSLVMSPLPQADGWWRMGWKAFQENPTTSSSSTGPAVEHDWQKAWHGCKIQALYSIMYHGELRAFGKHKDEGVYCHKSGTAVKANNYSRFTPLFRDGIY